jgi:hypothetical protein
MYRLGPPHVLYEWKCYTPFRSKGALGNGSRRCGGAASTTDGNSFAFGNTLEWLLAVVLGKKARGAPTDPPLDRRTGLGRVDATPGQTCGVAHRPDIATRVTTVRRVDVIRYYFRAWGRSRTTPIKP